MKDELVKRLARSAAGLPPIQAPPSLPSVGGAAAGGGGSAGVGGPIGTLVVCPMSVMGNWESQIKEHVKVGALKVRLLSLTQFFFLVCNMASPPVVAAMRV